MDNIEREAWNAYLQYLKDWAESHKEFGFIGCCPVCPDEWLEYEGKEYGKLIYGE